MCQAHTILHGCGHLEIVQPPEQIFACPLIFPPSTPSLDSPTLLPYRPQLPCLDPPPVRSFSFFACTRCIEKLKGEFTSPHESRLPTGSSDVLDEKNQKINIKNNCRETCATTTTTTTVSDDFNTSELESNGLHMSSLVNVIEGFDPTIAFLSPRFRLGSFEDGGAGRGNGGDDSPSANAGEEEIEGNLDTVLPPSCGGSSRPEGGCSRPEGSLYTKSLGDEDEWYIVKADIPAGFGKGMSIMLDTPPNLVTQIDKQSSCRIIDPTAHKFPLIIPKLFRMLHVV